MIPCAYLRVFRPLDTFPAGQRAAWERHIREIDVPRAEGRPGATPRGRRPGRRPVYRDEVSAEAPGVGLLTALDREAADIRFRDGRYFICPRRTRLRVLASMLSLRESGPSEIADVFVPASEARRAARELARLRRQDSPGAPAILQSAWAVPVHWFVLFDDAERSLTEEPAGWFRLSYWTSLGGAKQRVERAVRALARSGLEPVADLVADTREWLASFHPLSMLELDYAEVSRLFTWDELDNDHSAREIGRAVAALGDPNGVGTAAQLYQSVASRWADARMRESLN